MLRNAIKFPALFICRLIYRLFMLLPLKKDTILFSAYEGNEYTCNPKYIYEYIRKHCGTRYRTIWLHNRGVMPPQCDATVRFLSLSHIVALATSRWIVSNLGIEPFFTRRKDQIVVNTWHGGGAYKNSTIGTQVKSCLYREYARSARAKNTTYYLSSCQMFTNLLSDAWHADKNKFLPVGSPRNDIFFSKPEESVRKDVLKKLGLSNETKYVLYAPTFRGEWLGLSFRLENLHLDFSRVLRALEKRFGGKFKFLFRMHINTKGWSPSSSEAIDVSGYPDIQEIMLIADAFITDYSSSIWDWAMLRKPGFLFTPDLSDYEKDRGLYSPIETWAFPYAKTNEELEKLILDYDEKKADAKIQSHLDYTESFETGKASKQTVEKMGLEFVN